MTKPTGRPRGRPPKGRQNLQAVTNRDGVVNALLNIGGRGDPVSYTRYKSVTALDRYALEQMYRSDGLAKRVVDIVVDDATREWIEADEALKSELARIQAKPFVTSALKWSRLFGGAVIVALIDDGGEFDVPVRMGSVRAVRQLRVYDRHRVTWTTADIDVDPHSPNHGLPAFYRVQPLHGTPYRVHASRMHRLDGLDLPDEARQRNNGWGDSALQPVYQALINYGMTMGASANIVRDFVQTVLSVNGLSDMVRQGQDDLITKRAQQLDMTRSIANMMMIDAENETYDKRASSVAGLADLWDRFAQHVSSATGIPATKLLGRSPAGLNATGEGDERQWYDVVQAYRTDDISPLMNWLMPLIDAQSEWTDRPETMDWHWPPLGQPSEAEWSEIKLKTAQADALYMDRGGVDPAFLFSQRYGHGEYRPEADLSEEARKAWDEEQERNPDERNPEETEE